MKVNRQIILTSKDEELYGSLRRALRTEGDIEVDKFTEESLKNKNKIALIATLEEENRRKHKGISIQ